MTTLIQLSSKEPAILKTSILPVTDISIKIHELVSDGGSYLIQVLHSKVNTIIDFSNSKDYQLLYFKKNRSFYGASYVIKSDEGSFHIQTQAKWVLLIPFEKRVHNDVINKIEKIIVYNDAQKAELLKKMNEDYPITAHTSVGRLYTTVGRMKAENELNTPLAWRIGAVISVETGQRRNEMNALKWNQFYKALCENLKRDYPSMYESLFPSH